MQARLPRGICVSVPLRAWDTPRVAAACRAPGVVAVEVRLDLGRARTLPARWNVPLPVVATCRPVRQGGAFDGPEAHRLELIESAVARGARWVDLEDDVRVPSFLAAVPALLSRHDDRDGFRGIGAGLAALVEAVRRRAAPPAAVKWVVPARDGARALLLLREWIGLDPAMALGCDWIFFAAGEEAVATRPLSLGLGGRWAYVALDDASRTGPGQPTLASYLGDFGPPPPDAPRALFGVVGRDVRRSASPAMHNAWLAPWGGGLYLPVSQRTWGTEGIDAADLKGANVTQPYKGDAAALPGADGESRLLGAANTLAREGGVWRATNTDVAGILAGVARWRGRVEAGSDALVLGAGGAARAAARALSLLGARVTVAGRDPARAAWATAQGHAVVPWEAIGALRPAAVAQATPLGGGPADPLPMPAGAVGACRLLLEFVYQVPFTPLQRLAWEAGVESVVDGLTLLELQGAESFRIWTGREPGPEGGRALAAWLGRQATQPPGRLILVGPRASGKSTVAREAARILGWPFLDLDDEAARQGGAPAGDLLARDAGAFRILEARVLSEALLAPGPAVIATGGGVVESPSNRERLRAEPGVLWLDAPASVLRDRLRGAGAASRPALLGTDPVSEVADILRRRNGWYASVARARLASFDLPPTETARRAVAWLRAARGEAFVTM